MSIEPWQCPQCTLMNAWPLSACDACGSMRRDWGAAADPLAASPALGPSSSSEAWSCAACTLRNTEASGACTACGTPRPAGGGAAWVCQSCTVRNPSINANCSTCTMPRPDAETQFAEEVPKRYLQLVDADKTAAVRGEVHAHMMPPGASTTGVAINVLSGASLVIDRRGLRRRGGRRFEEYCLQEIGDSHARNKLTLAGTLHPEDSSMGLVPLNTTGDGNCLLHSASLAMWGIEDTECQLRAWVGDTMGEFERARWHRDVVSQQLKLPPDFRTIRDFDAEWETACKLPRRLADDVVRSVSDGGSVHQRRVGIFGSSLQSVHVYTLAQVLRRPVLVLGYEDIDTRDSDDSLAGLFLPTRWNPAECFKQPLVLGAMMGHFFAVVPFDTTTHIPLCRADGTPVQLRYEEREASVAAVSDAKEYERALIAKYVDVELVSGKLGARVAKTGENRVAEVDAMWQAYTESAWSLFNALAE